MQALCSQCSTKIAIDDAKVPDRPFSIKCPRCQNVMKLPGRGAAEAAPAEESRTAMPPAPPAGFGAPLPGERALVALTDRDQVTAATAALTRLGYPVDPVEDGTDAARQLEQGIYAVVATTRGFSAQGQGETLYQRITRLSPDQRRRLFVVLVGDEFRSGDGSQAFVLLADLVLNARDVAAADNLLRGTVGDRRRIYQAFNEARARLEAASTV